MHACSETHARVREQHTQVYPEAQTLVQEEDTQPLDKPIIAPIRTKHFDHVEKKTPVNPYSMRYLHDLCSNPELVRNVCIAGHLRESPPIHAYLVFFFIVCLKSDRKPAIVFGLWTVLE